VSQSDARWIGADTVVRCALTIGLRLWQIFRDREDATHRVSTMRSLQHLTDLPIPRVVAVSLDTARPEALAEAAYRWAAEIESFYSSTTKRAVTRLIDSAANTLGSFIPVVCHGDFGPQNVLFSGTTVTGLLDLEDVRLGHPLLDVGWWNWLVRAHTLIVLRLLETAATFRRTQPEKHASWGARIEKEIIAPAPSR
jgi:hypothetical protein